MLIKKANTSGHWVVTATQMMESMIKNPLPTRAEVSDVFNAICDGTDAVMLSGESAGGNFPAETVAMMAEVCVEAEQFVWPASGTQRLNAPAAAAYVPHAWRPQVGSAVSHLVHRSNMEERPTRVHAAPRVQAVAPAPPVEKTSSTQLFVLVSGKRAAGKDFCSEQMANVLNKLCRRTGGCIVTAFANSVKRTFASENGLDYAKLVSQNRADRDYKEQHRQKLTAFYEERRPTVEWICEQLVQTAFKEPKPGAIVISDLRHPSELQYFIARGFNVLTVRINCSDKARARRGWVPNPAKDSHPTEVSMDTYDRWDLVFDNSVDGPREVAKWCNEKFVIASVGRLKM